MAKNIGSCYNPSAQEVKSGGSKIQGHLWLHT